MSTFVVDDNLTIAIHGDKIDGYDPSNCVYGKTLVCICISIYSTLLLKNTKSLTGIVNGYNVVTTHVHHILPAPLQPARATVTHWSWLGNARWEVPSNVLSPPLFTQAAHTSWLYIYNSFLYLILTDKSI